MSKYHVDKFMRLVNANEAALKEYVGHPAGFVAAWDEREGGRLSPEERAALAERDYARLYALGAHPFLLWSFTEAIWVHEVPKEQLVRDYKEKTRAFGYPNFAT